MTIVDGDHRYMWGPHVGRIYGLAESCVDYLGSITRSLPASSGPGTT